MERSTRFRSIVFFLIPICIHSFANAATSLRGKVTGTLFNAVWNEAKDPTAHRYTFREPSPTVSMETRALTANLQKELCIVAFADRVVEPSKANPIRVSIAGGRTNPVMIVAPLGQLIQFENHDPFPHRLYEVSSRGLNATDTAAGQIRAFTPGSIGKYEIRDHFAPSIRSWIFVDPNIAAWTYPTQKGEFSLTLEPGKYKIRAYFEGAAIGNEITAEVLEKPQEQQLKETIVVGSISKGKDKKGAKE